MKIFINIFVLSLLALFSNIKIEAQPQQPSTPSAAVYNFSKYADAPPNLFTGAVSEYIPMGQVSAGPLSHSVGLSYYFGGHRPSDLASPAGLGFHIAAGGAITRQVFGIDDFDDGGWFETGDEVQGILGLTQSQVSSYLTGDLDPQMDLYSLQVGNLNIKFYIDQDKTCHTIPESDIEITLVEMPLLNGSPTYFMVKDAQGNRYYFGDEYLDPPGVTVNHVEKTTFNGDEHISAWYLYLIETHDQLHKIEFDYETHNYSYYSLQDCETVRWKNGSNEGYVDGVECVMTAGEVEIEGKLLTHITGLASTIDFNYSTARTDLLGSPKRIDFIEVSSGAYTTSYTFNHDYFHDSVIDANEVFDHLGIPLLDIVKLIKKLRLISISIAGTGAGVAASIPTYSFDYYRSDKGISGSYEASATFNKGIDRYGYANGVDANNEEDHIIPFTTVSSHEDDISYGHSVTIRNSNSSYSVASGLYKMTLPTGGTITYDYESNQFRNTQNGETSAASAVASSSNCNSPSLVYNTDNFSLTANEIATARLDWSITPLCIKTLEPLVYELATIIIDILEGATVIDSRTYVVDSDTLSSFLLNTLYPDLKADITYTLRVGAIKGISNADIIKITSGTDEDIGGLRLKTKTTDDADGDNSNNIVRTYRYVDLADNSSGIRYKIPKFGHGFSVAGTTANALFTTASIRPFSSYEGHHIGYQRVVVDLNGNGEVIHKFYTDLGVPSNPDFPPVPEHKQRYLWGQAKEISVLREGDNVVLQNTQIHIPFTEYNLLSNSKMFAVRRVRLKTTTGATSADFDEIYRINTGTFRPSITKTTNEGLSYETISEYNSSFHLLPTEVRNEFENNEVYKKNIAYTLDNSGGSTPTVEHGLRNIIEPYIGAYIMDGDTVRKTKTNYGMFEGAGATFHPRPDELERTYYDNLGASIEETDDFFSYNNNGLLTAFTRHGFQKNDVYTYNSNSLITSAGLDDLTRSFRYITNTNLIDEITEVDGTKTTYSYDAMMRLKTVTDATDAVTAYTYNISKSVQSHQSKITTTQTFDDDQPALSELTSLISHQYLDGLGRTVQAVGQNQTSNNKDQISAVAYDSQGRMHKNYEVFASTVNTGAYANVPANHPVTTTVFESSSLNRPSSITPPNFGTQTFTYGTNSVSFNDANNNSIAVGDVFQKTIIDGNGNQTQTFIDVQGRKLMNRRANSSGTTSIDTKYDYDWRNLLKEVVPPGSTITTDALNFIYTRDKEGKVLTKKIPSKALISYAYDGRDLLIGYKDGFTSQQTQDWFTYQYDAWGRNISTGFYEGQPPNAGIIPETLLSTTSYGTSGVAKGKIQQADNYIIGTSDVISSRSTYENITGRLLKVESSNVFAPGSTRNDQVEFAYDGASNVVKLTENVRLGTTAGDEETVIFDTKIDDDGRTIAELIKLNSLSTKQLSQYIYNEKDLLTINFQGGTNTNYLQSHHYTYLDNQALSTINNGVSTTDADIFGYRLNYTESTGVAGNTTPSIVSRYNGDINSLLWAEDNQSTDYHNYRYDYLNRLLFDYTGSDSNNTSYTYDARGNFNTVTRKQNGTMIDDLTYQYVTGNANQLKSISEVSDKNTGYKQALSANYQYDTNGNLTSDPQKGVTITYNHLDLPERMTFDDGREIECIYDAAGNLLSKILKNQDGSQLQRHNYVGSFETINGYPFSIMHSQGRMVNEGLEDHLEYLYLNHQQNEAHEFKAGIIESSGTVLDNHTEYTGVSKIILTKGFRSAPGAQFSGENTSAGTPTESWRYEWEIRDHLGNLRINYTGVDSTNLTILQRQSYYPYGMSRGKNLKTSLENKYQFNGIDWVGDFGLDWSMATYRSLDNRGVWNSVDPKAEKYASMSPYNSMGNSPIVNADPLGDDFGISALIGAGIGLLSNGAANLSQGNGFFDGGFKAALIGGIGGAASFGIGEFTNAMSTAGVNLSLAGVSNSLESLASVANIGGHAALGGLSSVASGGGFGSGALSGGFGAGSGMAFGGLGDGGMLASSAFSGGVGSVMGGGNFWQGAGQGLISGGLNHVAHQVQEKINVLKEKRLIKKLMCRCIEEYSTNPNANLKNIIEDNINNKDWVGSHFETKVKLDGHTYRIYVSGLRSGFSTQIGDVGFDIFSNVFLGGDSGQWGRAGFYVASGYRGARLISIGTSNQAALNNLNRYYAEYIKY